MIIKISRLPLIIWLIIIILFTPGYFGFYSPFIEGSHQNAPYWFNIAITLLLIIIAALIIQSLFWYIEISDAGITQKTIRLRTLRWQDIKGWGYYYGSDAERNNIIFLDLVSDDKRELIDKVFLNKNFPVIKMELEKRLGEAIFTTKQCKC